MDFDIESASPAPALRRRGAQGREGSFIRLRSFRLDFPESKPADSGKAASSLDLTDLSLDSGGGDADGEAVGTKLELAKAYLEIGDKDGARDILQEVAKEGSSAQKEEAKKLIASL
jgi:pilus assembly protein FimV